MELTGVIKSVLYEYRIIPSAAKAVYGDKLQKVNLGDNLSAWSEIRAMIGDFQYDAIEDGSLLTVGDYLELVCSKLGIKE